MNNILLIILLAISVFLSSVGTSLANVSLPAMAKEFELSIAQIQWVVSVYLGMVTALSIFVGYFSDRMGRRKIYLLGLGLYLIGSILAAGSISFFVLVLARAIQGIAASVLLVLPISIVADGVIDGKTGRAVGFLASMSAVGTATGPSLGGFITASWGWRYSFGFLAVIAFINLLIAIYVLPKNLSQRKMASSFFLKSHGVQLFMNLVVAAIMMATLIVGPFYLSKAFQLSSSNVGLVMSVGPIVSIISGYFCGYIVDRFGSNRIIFAALIQLLIASISFIVLPELFSIAGYIVAAAFLSIGYQLFQAANSTLILKTVAPEKRTVASGLLSLTRNVGLFSGSIVMGWIFAFSSKQSINQGLQTTFAFVTALVIILLIIQIKESEWKQIL